MVGFHGRIFSVWIRNIKRHHLTTMTYTKNVLKSTNLLQHTVMGDLNTSGYTGNGIENAGWRVYHALER